MTGPRTKQQRVWTKYKTRTINSIYTRQYIERVALDLLNED